MKSGKSKILRIDSSASNDSISRRLGDEVVRRLQLQHPSSRLIMRDLNDGIDFINSDWVEANLTPPAERSRRQKEVLQASDQLIDELQISDVLVITAPVYNYSLPAVLKAYIDMVCRAGVSFRYSDNGPAGLLRDRPVYLVMASGGVAFGSPADFASGYLRHVLSFIGINDIRTVYAEATNSNAAASENEALDSLSRWLPDIVTTAA